jgi:hypothetical protein
MNVSQIQFRARATGPDLVLTAKFDGEIVFSQQLTTQAVDVQHQFQDTAGAHVLELTLSGKLPQHTTLDSTGAIRSDQVIEISDVQLDDIDLGLVFWNHCRYQHNFNGTAADTEENFYGVMGCNGTVRFEFVSPIYQWLLENL